MEKSKRRKIEYEKPELVDMVDQKAMGLTCSDGSGNIECYNGPGAGVECDSGAGVLGWIA